MRRYLISLLALVGSVGSLFSGESSGSASSSIASSVGPESPPSSFVNSVQVTSGHFFFSTNDLTIPGPCPLHVSHSYNSETTHFSWMGKSPFSSNFPIAIVGFELQKRHRHMSAKVSEANGSQLSIVASFHKNQNELHYFLNPDLITNGFTNSHGEEISARSNLKNSTYILHASQPDAHRGGNYIWYAKLGDGTERTYHRAYSYKADVHLENERRPSGHILEFAFHEHSVIDNRKPIGRLQKIELLSPDKKRTLGWMHFKSHSEDHEADIETCNGKTAHYEFSSRHKGWSKVSFIKKIVSSDAPTVHFNYDNEYRLERIEWPEGRFLEMDYDKQGRVKAQKAPCGKEGEKRTLFEFEYKPDDCTTNVRDAYDRKITYKYSKEKRLKEVRKYDDDKKLYRAEYFHWGKGHTLIKGHKDHSEEGYLLSKAIVDETEKGLFCWKAKYDDVGNIIKETIYGNLSGCSRAHFKVSDEASPNTDAIECYHTYASFYNNQFHMKKAQAEDSGPTIRFAYKDKTNLLTSKLTYDDKTIKIREFFDYDDDHVCIEKILDDGSSENISDLKGVSERKIIRIKPVKSKGDYGAGQPAELQELYLDVKKRKEILFKRFTFTYDKAGRVLSQSVYDQNNKLQYTLKFTYDDKGRITSKTDAIGRKITYAYDENGNKTREELVGSGSYATYAYDKMNRLVKEALHYDTGEVFNTEYEYDLIGNKTKITDHFGNVTEYVYDEFGRCVKEILPATSAGRSTIKKSYDIFDKVLSQTDPNGHTTTYTRTVRGEPITITYPDKSVERFEYNLNGTIKHKWEKNGLQHSYNYDFLKRPIQEKVFDSAHKQLYTISNRYNAFHLLSTTDAMGFTTTYQYDCAGRKREEKKVQGSNFSKKTMQYDAMGRLLSTKEWSSDSEYVASVMQYDRVDRVIQQEIRSSNNVLLSKQCFQYDIHDNKSCVETFQEENKSFSVRMVYNSMNLLKEKADELGNITQYRYNFHCKNTLKQQVLETTVTDPLGQQTITTFDALHNTVTVQKKKDSVLLAKTNFRYDLCNNKIAQEEEVIVSGEKERTYTITWKYDACNRTTEITEQPGTSDEKKTKQEYTSSGALKTLIKPNGITLNHRYDALDRLSVLTSSEGTIHYLYTYDLNGNVLQIEDKVHNVVQNKTYDAWNRLIKEDALSFTYDPLGRITSFTLPDHSSTRYLYADGHLHDVLRCDASGKELYRHSYTKINLREEVEESTLPHTAGKITTAWDAKGRAVAITAPHFYEKIPASGIDACDNVHELQLTDTTGSYTNTYTYDELYQITSEAGLYTHNYANDSIANRRKKDSDLYTIDPLNRLQSSTETSFTYDKNGNMISSITAGKTTQYRYDALDRLLAMENDTVKAEYLYDSLNRRLQKKVSKPIPGGWEVTKDERYLYLGKKEVGSIDSSGAIQEVRILGRGKGAEVGASVALELHGALYVPIHDGRGNIVELLTPTGGVADTMHYSSFGEYSAQNNISPWLFVSKRYDAETGFTYFGSRYYSAAIGRWVTPDPLGFADGPNLYAYVHNSPLILIDPWGMLAEGDTAIETQLKSDIRSGDANSQDGKYSTSYRGRDLTVTTPEESLKEANAPFCSIEAQMRQTEGGDPYIQNRYVDIKGPNGPLPFGAKSAYNNGYGNSLQTALDNAIGISNSIGGHDITLVYNHSEFIVGMTKYELNAHGVPTDVCYLDAGLMNNWARQNPGADIYDFLHSHGAAQGKVSLSFTTLEAQRQMNVVTLGGARMLTKGNLKSLHQFVSRNDPIPAFFPSQQERLTALEERTLEVLEPASGASRWFDHSCLSPTYQNRIEKYAKDEGIK